MSTVRKILAVLTVCSLALAVTGCGGSEPDVPLTKEEKIKAIDANPDYKPEQKTAYKQQVEQVEKDKAMAAGMGAQHAPKGGAAPVEGAKQ